MRLFTIKKEKSFSITGIKSIKLNLPAKNVNYLKYEQKIRGQLLKQTDLEYDLATMDQGSYFDYFERPNKSLRNKITFPIGEEAHHIRKALIKYDDVLLNAALQNLTKQVKYADFVDGLSDHIKSQLENEYGKDSVNKSYEGFIEGVYLILGFDTPKGCTLLVVKNFMNYNGRIPEMEVTNYPHSGRPIKWFKLSGIVDSRLKSNMCEGIVYLVEEGKSFKQTFDYKSPEIVTFE